MDSVAAMASGAVALPKGYSPIAEQANAVCLESIDAFGVAAIDELARPDSNRKAVKANLIKLHRQRRAEIKRIAEAFGRGSLTEDDRCLLRFALEASLATLDGIYKDFRRAVNIVHEKG